MSPRQVAFATVILTVVFILLAIPAYAAEPTNGAGDVVCTALTTLKPIVVNDANKNVAYDEGEFEVQAGFFLVNLSDLSAPPMSALSGQRTQLDPARWSTLAVHSKLYWLAGYQVLEVADPDDDGFPSNPSEPPVFEGLITEEAGAIDVVCGRHYVLLTFWRPFEHEVALPFVINN